MWVQAVAVFTAAAADPVPDLCHPNEAPFADEIASALKRARALGDVLDRDDFPWTISYVGGLPRTCIGVDDFGLVGIWALMDARELSVRPSRCWRTVAAMHALWLPLASIDRKRGYRVHWLHPGEPSHLEDEVRSDSISHAAWRVEAACWGRRGGAGPSEE